MSVVDDYFLSDALVIELSSGKASDHAIEWEKRIATTERKILRADRDEAAIEFISAMEAQAAAALIGKRLRAEVNDGVNRKSVQKHIQGLENSLRRLIMAMIAVFEKRFPITTAGSLQPFLNLAANSASISILNLISGLVLAARQIRSIGDVDFQRFMSFRLEYFEIVLMAYELLGMLKRASEIPDIDTIDPSEFKGVGAWRRAISPLSMLKLRYFLKASEFATALCKNNSMASAGLPSVVLMDDEEPPVISIGYRVLSNPEKISDMNAGLARKIGSYPMPIPYGVHLCFEYTE